MAAYPAVGRAVSGVNKQSIQHAENCSQIRNRDSISVVAEIRPGSRFVERAARGANPQAVGLPTKWRACESRWKPVAMATIVAKCLG
jgi:hypothetical protein